jgi:hypothetical protein
MTENLKDNALLSQQDLSGTFSYFLPLMPKSRYRNTGHACPSKTLTGVLKELSKVDYTNLKLVVLSLVDYQGLVAG